MSVLIKGMEMPKEGFVEIIVWADGLVQQTGQTYRLDGEDYYTPYIGEVPKEFSATEIPPHGRLIDVDYADEYAYDELELANNYLTGWEAARAMQKIYQNAPTVIEAEEGEG